MQNNVYVCITYLRTYYLLFERYVPFYFLIFNLDVCSPSHKEIFQSFICALHCPFTKRGSFQKCMYVTPRSQNVFFHSVINCVLFQIPHAIAICILIYLSVVIYRSTP